MPRHALVAALRAAVFASPLAFLVAAAFLDARGFDTPGERGVLVASACFAGWMLSAMCSSVAAADARALALAPARAGREEAGRARSRH